MCILQHSQPNATPSSIFYFQVNVFRSNLHFFLYFVSEFALIKSE
ncbi:hypothetical protein HMP0015_1038 [Acinetobacter haemolyticus ATCC 19194]|uniref:Uncharacterized protein n=1 Tax=Acinetobacter haemolyticus ATCC 19194 TaxID=707232 RepID=D4XMU6_ACIHA|nr:hypothetical protein HMP0015_1038 [Acinetobacter haemolyticus ATCC 19194]